ncbi:7-deoxyloganetin glucosyltransferase [Ranunculus cassubicifolius]
MKSDNQNSYNAAHHVLVLPFPSQGHINPMLQFSKRLVSKGLTVTLAVTNFIGKTMPSQTGSIHIKTISDGFDEGGSKQAGSGEVYLDRFKIVGSQTLRELILKQNQEQQGSKPFSCIVYDAFLPWAFDAAKQFSLVGALFFTQSCAVNTLYYHVRQGLLPLPIAPGSIVSLPGLPSLEMSDLPSFISTYGSNPAALSLLVTNQFRNIDEVDWILVNTFDKMEQETIGPTLPSAYLDNRIEDDKNYDLNLFEPSRDACMEWLNRRETGSVVYVSFGSVAPVTSEQMEEVAWALRNCHYHFLWVIRESEMSKLPSDFVEETSENGLVVKWCPQLEVLSHPALGCFVTHCGWNSTLEALSLGVPMVTLPQLSDQPTNAKYVTDIVQTGNRARVDKDGVARRNEIEACIKQIMEERNESNEEIRVNAKRWKMLAKEAVDEGGSSDINIHDFISNLTVRHSN